jgi:cytochrome c oxidase subunit 1
MSGHAHDNINYLKARHGLMSWLVTVDHKRIGLMYLGSILAFFITGGLLALLFRLELWSPEKGFITAEI